MFARRTDTRTTSLRGRLRPPSVKGMLLSTAFVSVAAILGVSAAGGSFATWNGADSVGASTIRSGTLGITISGPSVTGAGPASYTLANTPWSALLPGDVAAQQVSVTNTGTTPVTLTVSTTASAVIDVRVQSGACSGTITGNSSTITPTILAGTLAGGATIAVCIQVSLTPAATQNQPAPFTMTFVANQEHP
ncbi:MAG: hypothetical protein ABI124_03390 [Terrimesophilobacter sp.]